MASKKECKNCEHVSSVFLAILIMAAVIGFLYGVHTLGELANKVPQLQQRIEQLEVNHDELNRKHYILHNAVLNKEGNK